MCRTSMSMSSTFARPSFSPLYCSEAYKTTTQNWMWTGLGDSPLSLMCDSTTYCHFSHIHMDIARRNWVVSSLLASERQLNEGVEALFLQRTNEYNLAVSIILFSLRIFFHSSGTSSYTRDIYAYESYSFAHGGAWGVALCSQCRLQVNF